MNFPLVAFVDPHLSLSLSPFSLPPILQILVHVSSAIAALMMRKKMRIPMPQSVPAGLEERAPHHV